MPPDADFEHPTHPFALVVNILLITFTPEMAPQGSGWARTPTQDDTTKMPLMVTAQVDVLSLTSSSHEEVRGLPIKP